MNINDIFTVEQYDEAYKFVSSHEYTTIEDLGNGQYQIVALHKPSIEELENAEKNRISNLTCTKRIFVLMLNKMGISYSQVKELLMTNEQAQLEWELCVELLRSNPLLDSMGSLLNITSSQLDQMFRYANGEVDNFTEG